MYKLLPISGVLRVQDTAAIPADLANTDYAAYLIWLSEGNTPEPADAIPVPVTTTLTMKQARLALLSAGYLDNVILGVSQMSREAQIIWEFADTVQRSDPLTQALAGALGLDEAALDELFTAGALL